MNPHVGCRLGALPFPDRQARLAVVAPIWGAGQPPLWGQLNFFSGWAGGPDRGGTAARRETGPSPTTGATWVAYCAPKQGLVGCAQDQPGKKGPQGSLFLAPGRHRNLRNVNILQLLVPVALLGWPEGRGGTPATQVAYPPPPGGCSTARAGLVQPGPQPPAPQTGAARHPCKGLQTQPEKFTMGFFATLVAYLNPCLNFFYFFFKMRTRTQGVGPDRWPVLQQGLWWPIHIAPQACRFGVWGGMVLRPGPHVCLLPPWWLTLGYCTAIGGRTRLGRWLAGPCPPCVANRPSVAHWQNHWGQATEPTMVRACPPSLVCMLHATIFEVPTAGCGPNVSFLEVSRKPPAKHFQAQLHHNGARWPKSEGTFL